MSLRPIELLFGAGLLALLLAMPARARADGAFPDSLSIFAPIDKQHEIVLATNFGLLITEDDGVHWRWVCEQAITTLPYFYQLGPPPSDTLFAISLEGLFSSKDQCLWPSSQFTDGPLQITDVWADPTDAERVMVIGRPNAMDSTTPDGIYESRDGARTFPSVLYRAPAAGRLESIETARADPRIIYLTMSDGRPVRRFIVRSTDGGAHWEAVDQTTAFGGKVPLIAAVDPDDPRRIYFRVLRDNPDEGDALAITDDGGTTVRIAFTLTNRMSAFLRRPDGTLIIGTVAGGYISMDHGANFGEWRNAPRIRALAERSGSIFAAADNFADGFAVGVTSDLGATWKPLLRYDQIEAPLACGPVQTACNPQWPALVAMFGIGDMPARPDAGMSQDMPIRPASGGGSGSGCKCGTTAAPLEDGQGWLAAVLVGLLVPRSLESIRSRDRQAKRRGPRR